MPNLRDDQWDLIVLAMQKIVSWTSSSPESQNGIDALGRVVLRRRSQEIITEIQRIHPNAGK